MKKLCMFTLTVFPIVGFWACQKTEQATEGAKAEVKLELSPEMQDFIQGFGSSNQVETALKKHGAENLDTKDMELYDLKSPSVTSLEKQNDQTCYTLEAKAGITIRTYVVCWKGSKIVAIEDKGLR